MSKFQDILTSTGEDLLKLLYKSSAGVGGKSPTSPREYARSLGLTYAQFVCALGFNPHIRDLPDVIEIVGFESYEILAREHVPNDMQMLEVMQYLLSNRLRCIEDRIEATVNSIVIERYKKEMRAIYNDGVAQIEFAEERLRQTHSGFRALLNEVVMIVEARLIPIGDLFFRDTILPEEKRRLIMKGLIPKTLVEQRLEDDSLSPQERKVLEEQLRLLPN